MAQQTSGSWRIDEASIVTLVAFVVSLIDIVVEVYTDHELDRFTTTHGIEQAKVFWYIICSFVGVYILRFGMSYDLFARVPKVKYEYVSHMPFVLQLIESGVRIAVGLFLIVGLTDWYPNLGYRVVNLATAFGATGQQLGEYSVPPTKLSIAIGYFILFFCGCIFWDIILLIGTIWAPSKWQLQKKILLTFARTHMVYILVCAAVLGVFVHAPLLDFMKRNLLYSGATFIVVVIVAGWLAFWRAGICSLLVAYTKHLNQNTPDGHEPN